MALCEDLKTSKFWKALLAEFIGTLILVFVGAGSAIDKNSNSVSIALTFGITVATVVWAIGHASGGHINPAVSIALAICRRISIVKAVFYVLAQVVGSIAGAALLLAVIKDNKVTKNLGATKLDDVAVYQGVLIELIITGLLVLTVLAAVDTRRRDLGGSGPLAIGLCVTACHIPFIPLTGASMNPARSFGVAVIGNYWVNHWIYWVGPILGGLVASFIYETTLARDASFSNFCCFTIENRGSEAVPTEDKKEEKEMHRV